MRIDPSDLGQVLANIVPLLSRRRNLIFFSLLAAFGAALLFFLAVGERYETHALLRVGQGIKERSADGGPFADGVDLSGRIDSLARITVTDRVIRQAVVQVGPEKMLVTRKLAPLGELVNIVLASAGQFSQTPVFAAGVDDPANLLDGAAIQRLRSRISARQEGRSNLLRISYYDVDAPLAAAFVNALAESLVATYADLTQTPGAEAFFREQTRRLEEQAEQASADLLAFSASASIYAVTDQRALLLKRADELASRLAATRAANEERKGQKQALTDQLMLLRPVAQSRTVTSIVRNLGGRDHRPEDMANKDAAAAMDETPPLLLVRVYQDNMAALMKLNAELAGALKLEATLTAEIKHVNSELAALAAKEAEYNRLKRALARASAAAESYGQRIVEEQLHADITKQTQLSSVRIVHLAQRPITPIFPQAMHLAAVALIGGLLLGLTLSVYLEQHAVEKCVVRVTPQRKRANLRPVLRAAE